MGAKYNFVLASESVDADCFRRTIADLEPIICRILGSIKTATVHNYITNHRSEWAVEGRPSEEVSDVSDSEIFFLYPEETQKGCVMLTREGRYMVISVILSRVQNPNQVLRELWQRVGNGLRIALMGEELDVNEQVLDSLSRTACIPEEADLCDAAIVKIESGNTPGANAKAVEYGGVLIQG